MKNLISTTFLFFICLSTIFSQCYTFEFPTTYDRKEILLGAHHDPCTWELLSTPRYNRKTVLSNNVLFKGLNTRYETCTGTSLDFTVIYEILLENDELISVPANESIEINLADGEHTGIYRVKTIQPNGSYDYSSAIEFSILVKSSASTYELPDEVWTINSATSFVPSCSNGYSTNPSNRWYQYSQPSSGFAKAYIKYGNDDQGNKHQSVTRPIILVEGVDFPTYQITDSEINEVVRIGTNGWENVIQGLLPSKLPEGEAELFEEYPDLMTNLRTSVGGNNISNYDIILVDFGDGADYMDKNAEIVIELIKRINQEKECDFENVILGLSMGGQVARLALTLMEERGEDHQCRQYVSFDSPHENATIPLAIQAFAFTNAFFSDDPCGAAAQQAGDFWFYLNKPATKQMLSERFLAEFQQGNIQYEIIEKNIEVGIYNVGFAADQTHSIYDYFDNSLDHNCLFEEYQLLKERLGYPKMCKNIAIANGSGQGFNALPEVLNNSDDLCLFKGYGDLDLNEWAAVAGVVGVLYQSYIDFVGGNVIAKIVMNAMPGLDSEIVDFGTQLTGVFYETLLPRINQQDLIVAKFKINNTPFLNYEISPGCERNDIQASIRPAFLELDDAFIDAETPCWSDNATFMPTYSVIGFANPPGTFSNIQDLINDNRNLSPFDEVHLPQLNQPHVKVNEGNSSFLFSHLNSSNTPISGISILPSQNLGRSFNYSNSNRRVGSFSINNSAVLGFNLLGDSGFEKYPEQSLNRENYFCGLASNICLGNSIININQGGKMFLGDPSNELRSAHLQTLRDTEININGGELKLSNNSSLKIVEGSHLYIESGSIIELAGSASELILEGNLQTNGDVVINCFGKFIISSTATFELGGKLTINGIDINEDLLLVNGNHTIHESIEINNGTIRFVNNASLSIEPLIYDDEFTATFNNIKVLQDGITNSFIDLLSIKKIGYLSIDNFISQNLNTRNILTLANISQVDLSRVSTHNCYKSLIAANINTLSITDSRFKSTPVVANEQSVEYFHGVLLSDINTVSIDNSSFNGFGDFYDSANTLYSLQLIDCPIVDISNTEFLENKCGIYIPFDLEEEQYDVQANRTNLYLQNVLFQDNFAGVDMIGYTSDFVDVNSSGLISMECVRMYDNFYGVTGEDILVQADHYFANEESSINIFRPIPKNSPGGGGGGSVSFKITFTKKSYSEIFLRGNAWYNFDSNELFLNADGSWAQVIKQPGINASEATEFSGCINTIQVDDPCVGCFQEEDDQDCNFVENNKSTNIATIYREANEAVRARDFENASIKFTPLATIESSVSSNSLPSKCAYQTHIARVFSKPAFGDDSSVKLREKDNSPFSVGPNPSSDFISLDGIVESTIVIFNSNGNKLVKQLYTSGNRIDISSFAPGLYFVHDLQTKETSKFIVIR